MGNLPIKQALNLKQSQEFSPKNLVTKATHHELSVYNSELTKEGLVKAVSRIQLSFPSLSDGFYTVLADRIKEIGFGDKRLMDAVNNVIDNCTYPIPTIAQFLSYDKHIELLDYEQFLKRNNELCGRASKFYKAVKIKGFSKPMWAKIRDIEQYNLETFKTKKDENKKR